MSRRAASFLGRLPLLRVLCLVSVAWAAPGGILHAAPESSGEPTQPVDRFDSPWTTKGFVRGMVIGARSADLTGGNRDIVWGSPKARLGAEYQGARWTAEARADLEWLFTDNPDSLAFRAISAPGTRNRALPLDDQERVAGDAILRRGAHRFNGGYKTDSRHIVVGRQAVSWGEGRLINPLDLITPRGPFILDSEDVPGADAVNYTEFFGLQKSLQFVVVPYRQDSHSDARRIGTDNTNAVARWQSGGEDLEWSVIGGRHFRSSVAGVEAVLLKWDASIRLAALGRREESDILRLGARDKSVFVLGWSYAFQSGRLPITLEALYNDGAIGNDLPTQLMLAYDGLLSTGDLPPLHDDATFFQTRGRTITRQRLLLQGSVGRELDPIQRIDALAIYDPRGRSVFAGLSYTRSLSDESVWISALQLFGNRGGNAGEFAGRGPLIYSLVRLHF